MSISCVEDIDQIKDFISFYEDKDPTIRIMEMVKPYFLAPYADAPWHRANATIRGEIYIVERPNHGLAHGLRQGALAKDIFNILLSCPLRDNSGIVEWAILKKEQDPLILQKIEMASSFQRSGRESECSSGSNLERYKKYELQDVAYFQQHAQECGWFTEEEVRIFAEALLWSNPGNLDENRVEDLKYLRRILHSAHTLDLRRITSFDGDRIQKDAMDQLFGGELSVDFSFFQNLLWDRAGEYLQATGDGDLVHQRHYQDQFFIQTRNTLFMVDAICRIYNSQRFYEYSNVF